MAPRIRMLQVGERGGSAPIAAAALSIGLTNRLHILGAGKSDNGEPCISLWDARGNGTVLWKGEDSSESGAFDIVALSHNRLLCLLSEQGIVEIDGRRSTLRWRMDASGMLPVRMFDVGGTPVAIFQNDEGETSLSIVKLDGDEISNSLFEPPISGPRLAPGQVISLVLPYGGDRIMIAVNDSTRGFLLYRQDQDEWSEIVRDGAARYALNAAVQDGCLWGDKAAIAVGLSSMERQRMGGFSTPGEILLVDREGRVQILCGEARTSKCGFMSPLIRATDKAAWAQGTFTHLAAAEDTLIAALRRDDGGGEIYAFSKSDRSEQLGEFAGAVCGIFPNKDEFIIAVTGAAE